MSNAWNYSGLLQRCKRWNGSGDVRGHRAARGWTATADLVDAHPVTGRALKRSEWWIFERKEGGHV